MGACWTGLLGIAGCGEVSKTPDGGTADAPAIDAAVDAPPGYAVGGTVSGFAGRDLVLQLNGGDDLTINADGSFVFPTRLDAQAPYQVTVRSGPVCPERICTVANDSGTIGTSDITNANVTCRMPLYRLVSLNWGDDSIRVTDDLAAISNNAVAVPRIIVGSSVTIDSTEPDGLAVDGGRGLIYAAYSQASGWGINVFVNLASAAGNVAPTRRIVIANETGIQGLELDAGADRLYVAGNSGHLYVIANASTANGTVAPAATIDIANPGALALDRVNDRLYVGTRTQTAHVFDNARQITSATTATRTFTWTSNDYPRAISIDGCRNRLYLSNRNVSPTNHNTYVLDNAHTLTGTVDLAAAAARVTVPGNQVMSSALDSQGRFYFWPDSPLTVNIENTPESWSGAVTADADKVIQAVVNRGYGLDVVPY